MGTINVEEMVLLRGIYATIDARRFMREETTLSLRGRNFRAVFCRQKNGQRTLHLIEVKQAAHAATKGEG